MSMGARLVIDLARCRPQGQSGVQCSYKHHPLNKGIDALLEEIRFSLICRRCQAAPCVKVCPQKALEKIKTNGDKEGVLKRATLLCTGCGTCAMACPFGTIYPDLIPHVGSVCDLCIARLAPNQRPLCAQTCQDGSIEYREVTPSGEWVELRPHLIARVSPGSRWVPRLREKAER